MRSTKLLVATALVAAFVAGPVLAQEAMPVAPAAPGVEAPVKAHAMQKKHVKKHVKKHHAKKGAIETAPEATPEAAQ